MACSSQGFRTACVYWNGQSIAKQILTTRACATLSPSALSHWDRFPPAQKGYCMKIVACKDGSPNPLPTPPWLPKIVRMKHTSGKGFKTFPSNENRKRLSCTTCTQRIRNLDLTQTLRQWHQGRWWNRFSTCSARATLFQTLSHTHLHAYRYPYEIASGNCNGIQLSANLFFVRSYSWQTPSARHSRRPDSLSIERGGRSPEPL